MPYISTRSGRTPEAECPPRNLRRYHGDTSNSERVFSLLQMAPDGRVALSDAGRDNRGKLCCGLPQRESNVRVYY
jgi:hypothetical protein